MKINLLVLVVLLHFFNLKAKIDLPGGESWQAKDYSTAVVAE